MAANLLPWFTKNARDLPWRRTHDPYAIHVSEIMLQQTQVKTVIPFWERWLRELPTIETAAQAPSAKIHKLWEGLGYYTRVRNLQKAAQTILERHNGIFPQTFDEVLALPGIGRYTAGAICSIAFNQPRPILDGNVIRVLTRVFGIAENPKEKEANTRLWKLAEALVNEAEELGTRGNQSSTVITPVFHWENKACSALNQSLMELGALICIPRTPQCLICPVKGICTAFKENRTAELPNLGERQVATARQFIAFVVEQDGKFLVRQRPKGVVNAHLWEFPNVEINDAKPDKVAVAKQFFGIAPAKLEHLHTVKHSITRYRITLNAYSATFNKNSSKVQGVWKSPAQMRQLAFTAAHKRLASFAVNRILSGR